MRNFVVKLQEPISQNEKNITIIALRHINSSVLGSSNGAEICC